jgi:hypothetical protein
MISGFGTISTSSQQQVQANHKARSVIVEGVVDFFSAKGGTHEGHYQKGYILRNPRWLVTPPDTHLRIFLGGDSTFAEYLNKRVHVEGRYVRIPELKMNGPSFMYAYDLITVDTIYILR